MDLAAVLRETLVNNSLQSSLFKGHLTSLTDALGVNIWKNVWISQSLLRAAAEFAAQIAGRAPSRHANP